jgi:hypothetical protein
MSIELSSPISSEHHAIIDGRSLTFDDPQSKFHALAEAWDEDNLGMSTSNYQHSAHLQIIGMGMTVIPLLLERLRRGERRWVYALRYVTGEQPDTAEMRGDPERVIRAWLDWASLHGWDHVRVA